MAHVDLGIQFSIAKPSPSHVNIYAGGPLANPSYVAIPSRISKSLVINYVVIS